MFYDSISVAYKFTKGAGSERGDFMGNVLFLDKENYYSIIGTENSDLNEVFNKVFDQNLTVTSNPVLAIHKIKNNNEIL